MTYIITTSKKPYTLELKPKQKLIKINKCGDFIDLDANNQAQQELSIYGYCLYMRLVKLVNHAIWALSNNEIEKNAKLSIHQYNQAVKELIDKGYLVPHSIDLGTEIITKHAYYFYEFPMNN